MRSGLTTFLTPHNLQVDAATLTDEKRPDGTSGKAFQCPQCLGPKKEGKDKAGSSCLVWDFVVHPGAVILVLGSRSLIC